MDVAGGGLVNVTESICEKITGMSKPLFSPRSVFWRVNRELACGIAAPRAVLLQIAHPLVAAGVAEHSNFRKHRFARLYRTSMAAAAITFGSRDFALRAVRTINQKHRVVNGILKTQSGTFPAGTPYDANDPELKLWVLSTITESTLHVYELFVSRLSPADRESYYADSLRVAELFGIPDHLNPPSYQDFQVYYDRLMNGGVIQVSEQAKEIYDALFARTPSGLLLFAGSALGISLLPKHLREGYGFGWKSSRGRLWERIPPVCRGLRRVTPSLLCANPAATISQLIL
ncbi:MAG TPA: oxygenase MpaB family protein [Terriglobia bacterium]|nr:oxygenase MpaB family protein [Terriglobia bacterium]